MRWKMGSILFLTTVCLVSRSTAFLVFADRCNLGNPCRHGGTCHNEGHGHFSCRCSHGYYGQRCEHKVMNACLTNPCGSHGTCHVTVTDPFYQCSCSGGSFGSNCEYHMCHVKQCLNGGSCVAMETAPYYRCQCTNGYTGDTCEVAPAKPQWTQWFYGACSVTCGNGTVVRIRKCSTGHDEDCDGPAMENTTCHENQC